MCADGFGASSMRMAVSFCSVLSTSSSHAFIFRSSIALKDAVFLFHILCCIFF